MTKEKRDLEKEARLVCGAIGRVCGEVLQALASMIMGYVLEMSAAGIH